jgi:hypothetical protein
MVFNIILKIFKTGFLFVLLNDYLKRTYPEKYQEYCIIIFLKLINIYSRYQIFVNRISQNIPFNILFFKLSQMLNYNKNIEFILDGKVIFSTYREKYFNKYNINYSTPSIFDFVIYSDYTIENICMKKLLSSYSIIEKKYDYEISNIKFLLLEVYIGEKCYKVNLKNDSYNFYLVDNSFDFNFFLYYLKTYCKEKDIDDTYFTVKIIDQNVISKQFVINNKNHNKLIINKDNYTIVE